MPPRLLLLFLLLLASPSAAQTDGSNGTNGTAPAADSLKAASEAAILLPAPRPTDAEARVFYAVYDIEHPAFVGTMRAANGASMPLFIAAVPVSGLAALATGESAGPTGLLALSELGALGLVAAGKFAVDRARPFVTLSDVSPRQRRPPSDLDPYSFPSGHSALAFAIATSTSLSYPEWYVIAPAYLWATATATARIWFGMHYASDTVVGAAVGAGSALLVHAFLDGDEEDEDPGAAARVPAFTIRVGL